MRKSVASRGPCARGEEEERELVDDDERAPPRPGEAREVAAALDAHAPEEEHDRRGLARGVAEPAHQLVVRRPVPQAQDAVAAVGEGAERVQRHAGPVTDGLAHHLEARLPARASRLDAKRREAQRVEHDPRVVGVQLAPALHFVPAREHLAGLPLRLGRRAPGVDARERTRGDHVPAHSLVGAGSDLGRVLQRGDRGGEELIEHVHGCALGGRPALAAARRERLQDGREVGVRPATPGDGVARELDGDELRVDLRALRLPEPALRRALLHRALRLVERARELRALGVELGPRRLAERPRLPAGGPLETTEDAAGRHRVAASGVTPVRGGPVHRIPQERGERGADLVRARLRLQPLAERKVREQEIGAEQLDGRGLGRRGGPVGGHERAHALDGLPQDTRRGPDRRVVVRLQARELVERGRHRRRDLMLRVGHGPLHVLARGGPHVVELDPPAPQGGRLQHVVDHGLARRARERLRMDDAHGAIRHLDLDLRLEPLDRGVDYGQVRGVDGVGGKEPVHDPARRGQRPPDVAGLRRGHRAGRGAGAEAARVLHQRVAPGLPLRRARAPGHARGQRSVESLSRAEDDLGERLQGARQLDRPQHLGRARAPCDQRGPERRRAQHQRAGAVVSGAPAGAAADDRGERLAKHGRDLPGGRLDLQAQHRGLHHCRRRRRRIEHTGDLIREAAPLGGEHAPEVATQDVLVRRWRHGGRLRARPPRRFGRRRWRGRRRRFRCGRHGRRRRDDGNRRRDGRGARRRDGGHDLARGPRGQTKRAAQRGRGHGSAQAARDRRREIGSLLVAERG